MTVSESEVGDTEDSEAEDGSTEDPVRSPDSDAIDSGAVLGEDESMAVEAAASPEAGASDDERVSADGVTCVAVSDSTEDEESLSVDEATDDPVTESESEEGRESLAGTN